jgi:hypothetical protein
VSGAFLIQQAKRMRHIIMSSVASLVLPYFFPTLFHKRHDSLKDVVEHKMRFVIFSANFV